MFWTQIFLAFFGGVIVNKLWGGFMNLGYSMLILKRTHITCLVMALTVSKSLNAMIEMKYKIIEKLETNEYTLELEQRIDKEALEMFQNTLIRNLITTISKQYPNLIQYENWDGAMKFLKEQE